MKQDMAARSANRSLTSKAVTYKSLGGYEVIEFVERTVRAPAAGEVRIEVKAAAVNPADLMFRDPGYPGMTSNVVPGMDAAGVIESVGQSVSRLHPGQKVIAAVNPVRPEGGAQAQHIVVPAASVVLAPEGVSLAPASPPFVYCFRPSPKQELGSHPRCSLRVCCCCPGLRSPGRRGTAPSSARYEVPRIYRDQSQFVGTT